MGLRVQFTPVSRTALLNIPKEQEAEAQALFGQFVRDQIAGAEIENARELGHPVDYTATVNGKVTADFDHLPPQAEVIVTFDIQSAKNDAITWIFEQLLAHAPVGAGRDPHPGLYRRSIVLLVNGIEVASTEEAAAAGPDDEIVFTDLQPYARKIEGRGAGVFEAVAALAGQRYGNVASIKFTFRTLDESAVSEVERRWARRNASRARNLRRQLARNLRQPAITVRFR